MFVFEFLFLLLIFNFTSAKPKQKTTQPQLLNAQFSSGIQLIYPKNQHLCGGALINSWYVLTAASCMEEFEQGWDLKNLILRTADGQQVRHVTTFFIHNSYNRNNQENNIAAIKANKAFEEEGVHPVGILDRNETQNCFVATYGVKRLATGDSSQTAKTVLLEPTTSCSINVTNTICMGSKNNLSICDSDYGSPAICNGQLMGIFIGPGDTCDGFPGVYVNATAYKEWLDTTVQNYEAGARMFRSIATPNWMGSSFKMLFLFFQLIVQQSRS